MTAKREKLFNVWFLGTCWNMYELTVDDHRDRLIGDEQDNKTRRRWIAKSIEQ